MLSTWTRCSLGDFQDSDGDGVDDRMQRGPGQPKGKVGQDYGKGNEGGIQQ